MKFSHFLHFSFSTTVTNEGNILKKIVTIVTPV